MNKKSLADFLLTGNYQQVPLRKLSTGHLVVRSSINDTPGLFILDPGAGATVVDEKTANYFAWN